MDSYRSFLWILICIINVPPSSPWPHTWNCLPLIGQENTAVYKPPSVTPPPGFSCPVRQQATSEVLGALLGFSATWEADRIRDCRPDPPILLLRASAHTVLFRKDNTNPWRRRRCALYVVIVGSWISIVTRVFQLQAAHITRVTWVAQWHHF